MAERSVLVRLMANIADFKTQMAQAERSVKGVGDESEKASAKANTTFGRMAESAQKNEKAWSTAGTTLTAFGAVTTLALGATVKAAMDWESAWAGVTKTVDGSGAELAKLETGLRGLARTLPATHGEIAAVAEAAGQLGVQTGSIVAFTRTMVDLGETTNLSADEAATSIAQMMNVMQTAPEDVDRMGSTLVALGNAGASTERDIIQMSQRISGAAAVIGMSEADVMAFANAVASMGIEVEAGGTSVSRVLTDMSKAAQMGGESLDVFAETAGMSATEFARAFKEDPAEAFASFIEGLGGIQEAGGNVFAVLTDLGLSDVRVSQALLGMASSGDLLRDSLDLGSKAWEENTALVEEAAKRYDTTASQVAVARNNITDAAIEIGEVFLPILADLAEGIAGVAQWFADLPDPIQQVIGGFAGIAGVGSLAAGAFLLIFPRVIETYKAFQTLSTTMPGVASNLGKLGKAAGVAAGMYLLGSAVSALDAALAPTPANMEEMTAALLALEGGVESLDAKARGLGENTTTEIDGFADAIKRVTDPSNMDRLNDFGSALFNVVTLGGSDSGEGAASRRRTLEFLGGIDSSLALMVGSGNADLAAEKFRIMAEEAEANGVSVEQLKELFPEYEAAIQGVANEQTIAADSADRQAQSTALLAQNLEATYGSIEGYAAAMGYGEDETQELISRTQELGSTLADFVNPLGVYTTMLDEKAAREEEGARKAAEAAGAGADAWRDFVTDTGFSFDEYMRRLQEQVEAQTNWQTNMLILAGRVSQGTLDELARMGPEGAPLVADLVNRSDAELDVMDDLFGRRSQEATDAWGAQMTMAAPVLSAIAASAGRGAAEAAARELAAGTTTIAEIARQYGVELAGGINPILESMGKPIVGPTYRRGSPTFMGPTMNADGNLYEDHVAQIAPGGAWRVWAEPETGGEAYIPLSPAKRTRSVDIWRQVGDRLGVQFQEFAFGGIKDVPKPYSTAPSRPPISTAADATMQKAYAELTSWLRENQEAIFGGTPGGGGSLAGGSGRVQQLFNTVRAAFPQARLNSGLRPGDSGFHGRGMAVDLGQVGRAGGNGHPYLAAMNRWIFDNFGSQTKELIYTGAGDDRADLKNGRPLNYGAATNAAHRNHVHWAMAKGGILNPHVRDAGGPLLPGYTFNGTGGLEEVVPRHVTDTAGRAVGGAFDYDRLGAAIARNARSLTVHTSDNPVAIVRAVKAAEQHDAALTSPW